MIFQHVKNLTQYIKAIREIERMLELPPKPFVPVFKKRPGVILGVGYTLPLIPGYLQEKKVLAFAVHEVRHVLQKQKKLRLIREEEVKNLLLPPEAISAIRKEARRGDEEVDAEIVERISVPLLRQGRVEEFKRLMLDS